MSTDIKGLYKSYLDGKTDIQVIDTYQGGRGRFLKQNWDGGWSAMSNVGADSWAVHSFNDKALAVGYLMGVDMRQLDLLDSIIKDAKESMHGKESILSDALFSSAPACNISSLVESDRAIHADLLSEALKGGNGLYAPTRAIYIDSTIGSDDSPTISFYRIDLREIESSLQYGIDNFSDVPEFANSIAYRQTLAEIPVSGVDDPKIGLLSATLAGDGRWCDVSNLDPEQFNRLMEVLTKNRYIVEDILLHGKQNKNSVERAVDLLGKAKEVGGECMEAIDVVMSITFERLGKSPFDAVEKLLNLYEGADEAGRGAIADTFQALTGKPFDSFIETTAGQCELLLGPYEHDESLDEMMEHTAEVVIDDELGDELGMTNGER